MNGFTSMLIGVPFLMVVLIAPLVILLVPTILFRSAVKWVANQEITFWISLGIVLLGQIAAIASTLGVAIPLTLSGAPEIAVWTIRVIIAFCMTSWIYLLLLNILLIQKINFWKASKIQLIMFAEAVKISLILALIIGFGFFIYRLFLVVL
jgi:hypothetical protein